MKFVRFENTERYVNSDKCEVWEYLMDDPEINCAIAKIKGRYPDKGYCVNTQCKSLIYILEGAGTLTMKNGEVVIFKEKDAILIDQNEAYFWNGFCTLVMPSTPAWTAKQYKMVD